MKNVTKAAESFFFSHIVNKLCTLSIKSKTYPANRRGSQPWAGHVCNVCMCVCMCGSVNSRQHKTRYSSRRENQSIEQMTAAKYLLLLGHFASPHTPHRLWEVLVVIVVCIIFSVFMYKQELCVNSLDLDYHGRLLKQHYSPMFPGAFPCKRHSLRLYLQKCGSVNCT